MGPEDRLARLLASLDRLPRGGAARADGAVAARAAGRAGGVAGLRPEQPGSRGQAGGQPHAATDAFDADADACAGAGSDAAGRRRRRWWAAGGGGDRPGARVRRELRGLLLRPRAAAERSGRPTRRWWAPSPANGRGCHPRSASATRAWWRCGWRRSRPGWRARPRWSPTASCATRWCSSWTGDRAGGW